MSNITNGGARHGLGRGLAPIMPPSPAPSPNAQMAFTFLRYRLFGLFPLGEPYQAQIWFYYHLRIAV